ncbi:MAG: HU family DNA-binding protein [Ignavibacteria bacterium]|nr:HU family DNA-binding protein [Ignavibacteria bacterium]
MERKEFLERVAAKANIDVKDAEKIFQKFIDLITTALRDGEKVSLAGFGNFSPKITKAVKKFSALLNREIEIPEKFTISFSPASKLADDINAKYKDEKPKVIQEAKEREIEKKVPIMPYEDEEAQKAEKLLEEISRLEEKSEEETDKLETEEEVSLSAELLEALKEVEAKTEQIQTEQEQLFSVPQESKEVKEEASQMPEMNLNQDKPKFTYGEDLSTSPSGGSYQQSVPSSATTDAPAFKEKESSNALWITLIILLIGIIGIGIYWALSSDVTESKKETVVPIEKETTPPVVIEKQPKTGKKEIIIAPEEYAVIPSDTVVKQKTPILVEEPKKEGKVEAKKPSVITEKKEQPTISKVEERETPTTIVQKKKPISRKTTRAPSYQKPTGTAQGDYFIQVNSYAEKKFADEFARNLRNKGYRAFVESAVNPNLGKVYRVKVGYYLDEDAAAKDYHSLRLMLKKEDIYVDRR